MLEKPILWEEKLTIPPIPKYKELKQKYPQEPSAGKTLIYMFYLQGGVYVGQTQEQLTKRVRDHLKNLDSIINAHYWGGYGLPEVEILAEVDREDAAQTENYYILEAIKRFSKYRVYNHFIGFSDSEGWCNKCTQILPLTDFNKGENTLRSSSCRSCEKKRQKEYYQTPHGKLKKQEQYKRHRNNPKKIKEKQQKDKEYQQTPRGKELARKKAKRYYQKPENKQRIKEYRQRPEYKAYAAARARERRRTSRTLKGQTTLI